MPPQADKIDALVRQVTVLEAQAQTATRADDQLRDRVSRLEERGQDHDRQLVRLTEQNAARTKTIDAWLNRLWTLLMVFAAGVVGYYLKR